MELKYSVVLATLSTGDAGRSVWEDPRGVLQTVATAGYDGVDMDAEPDRIEPQRFAEVRDLAMSLGLKIPALLGAWAPWHAGEERDLCSTDETVRRRGVDYAKRAIDLASTFDEPALSALRLPREERVSALFDPARNLAEPFCALNAGDRRMGGREECAYRHRAD